MSANSRCTGLLSASSMALAARSLPWHDSACARRRCRWSAPDDAAAAHAASDVTVWRGCRGGRVAAVIPGRPKQDGWG
jgi:hypothetical protein